MWFGADADNTVINVWPFEKTEFVAADARVEENGKGGAIARGDGVE